MTSNRFDLRGKVAIVTEAMAASGSAWRMGSPMRAPISPWSGATKPSRPQPSPI